MNQNDRMKQWSGPNLRAARHARGITAKAIGGIIGRSVEAVRAYERGAITPSADTACKLAAAVGCELVDLFEAAPESGVA